MSFFKFLVGGFESPDTISVTEQAVCRPCTIHELSYFELIKEDIGSIKANLSYYDIELRLHRIENHYDKHEGN
jgi:hypothetical protein